MLGEQILAIEPGCHLSVGDCGFPAPGSEIFFFDEIAKFTIGSTEFAVTKPMILLWLSVIIVVGFFVLTFRKAKVVPGRMQSLAEIFYEFIADTVHQATGDGGKRFHADWALWKVASDRTEMVWDSPWGVGFPGWHIECTAMSLELLGNNIDLHVGGIDLRFPHHENERAQTNAIAGRDVVQHWLHGEHLLFEGKKMAKSSGNVLLVSGLIEAGLDPLALRLALMENRYRSQMDLTWDSLRAADATLRRWRGAMANWGDSANIKFDSEINGFIMNDLELPKVLIRLRAIEKDSTIGALDKRAIFLYADQVLGLDLDRGAPAQIEAELTYEAFQLLEARAAARAAGNWAESDRIRDLLAKDGIDVRDGKDGQSWEIRI